MRRPWQVLCLSLGLLAAGAAQAEAPGGTQARRVVVLVDTSSSMEGNDGPRFTVLATQILSDLLDDRDSLTVIRTPPGPWMPCQGGCDRKMNPADRAGSKRAIHDLLHRYEGGTFFGRSMDTARQALSPRDADELLLVVTDAERASDEDIVSRTLKGLRQEGTTLASIALGNSPNALWSSSDFDHSGSADTPGEIVSELAAIYQRFLGGKRKVQSGPIAGTIAVDIDPYVKEAFLVVAAEGDIGQLKASGSNPSGTVDLDFRGGGKVRGADGLDRSYRIVRIDKPAAGRWQFQSTLALKNAGYMLLQDDAIGIRPAGNKPGLVPRDTDIPLEVELFDERTGQTIDTDKLVDLGLTIDVDGQPQPLRDDGTGGDRVAGDGILTVTRRFDKPGQQPVVIRLQTDTIDEENTLVLEVADTPWLIEPEVPERVEVGSTVPLRARLRAISSGNAPLPDEIGLRGAGADLRLQRKGTDTYEGSWIPASIGAQTLEFSVPAHPGVPAVSRSVEVVGTIDLGAPVPVVLGALESHTEGLGALDLSGATVRGDHALRATTRFSSPGSVLEVQVDSTWKPLTSEGVELLARSSGPNRWPVRMRVGGCPRACTAADQPTIQLAATAPDGSVKTLEIPISVTVAPDSLLVCYWWLLASALALALGAVLVHGRFLWPSSFAPQLVVRISPEPDIQGEGFPHALSVRGAGRGFYRHARAFVTPDYRVSGSSAGALARLRAEGSRVLIQPVGGRTVLYRQESDDEWRPLPPTEKPVSFSHEFRNEEGTLFFKLGNRL